MKKGLTELTGQLAAMWKQLGINQRVSLGLATGALLVGVVALALLSGRVSWALLYGGLDDTETAKVIAVLEETKIAYQVRGPGSVYVPAGQKYAARMQLSDKGILREGQGYELFDGSSFGVSDFLQRLNKKRAIEGELARTIMQMDAVEEARVQVPMEENTFLVDPQRKLTASVMVKARGAARLSESAVNSIQLTVANSVLGLEAGRVSVVDSRGEVLGGDDDATSAVGLSGGQLRARQELEDYLSRKAERMLTQVLGPGNATVTVNAEINWDTQTTYEEKYDPDGQVPRSETVDDEETSESPAAGGGVAGMASNTLQNGTNAPAGPSTPQKVVTTKKTVKDSQYDVPRTVSSLLQSPGSVQRLTAAVFVAPRFEGTGASRTPLPRSTNEISNLRGIVQSALGIREGDTTRNDAITLVEQEFDTAHRDQFHDQMERQTTRHFWTELGLKLTYPLLGLTIVWMFWRAFKRTPMEDVTFGLPLGDLALETDGNGNGHGTGQGRGGARDFLRARRNEPKTVTVDVLNQLIRENPGNMTQAVRTWLTRGKKTN